MHELLDGMRRALAHIEVAAELLGTSTDRTSRWPSQVQLHVADGAAHLRDATRKLDQLEQWRSQASGLSSEVGCGTGASEGRAEAPSAQVFACDSGCGCRTNADPGRPRAGEDGKRVAESPCDEFRQLPGCPGYCWCGWMRYRHPGHVSIGPFLEARSASVPAFPYTPAASPFAHMTTVQLIEAAADFEDGEAGTDTYHLVCALAGRLQASTEQPARCAPQESLAAAAPEPGHPPAGSGAGCASSFSEAFA